MLVSPALTADLWLQLNKLYNVQTRPFERLVPDYEASLRERRELEVRVAQLDKEAAELRDENEDLHRKLEAVEHLRGSDMQLQINQLKEELSKAKAEITDAYKDKSKTLEDLMSCTKQVKELETKEQQSAQQISELRNEIERLKEEISSLQQALQEEKSARQLAADECEVRQKEKVAAETKLGNMERENNALVDQLISLKHERAESLNKMNVEMEEMMAYTQRLQAEARAEMEAATLLKQKLLAAGGNSSLAAGMGWGTAAANPKAFPSSPSKTYTTHKQGCTSLAFDRTSTTVATCGVDRSVKTWNLALCEQSGTYLGAQASVNDVDFSCNGHFLLGASSDKCIRVWDTQSGKQRHALTGHTSSVTCITCSPVQTTLAASCGEDRCVKLWDLDKGICKRSFPCTKMPNALAITRGGDTMITGHLEGTICWWDMRQCDTGTASKPYAERREHTALITAVATTHCETEILTCSKDNLIRIWDVRTMSPVQTYRTASFIVGTIGSMGRGKNHVEISPDGQYLVAGGSDRSVVVWNLAEYAKGSKDAVKVLRHHKDAVVACGWSSDASVLLTGDKGGTIAFWHMAT